MLAAGFILSSQCSAYDPALLAEVIHTALTARHPRPASPLPLQATGYVAACPREGRGRAGLRPMTRRATARLVHHCGKDTRAILREGRKS
jgi:hypothetical protein